jgi:hypothetical protein
VISFHQRLSLSGIIPPSDAPRIVSCEDVVTERQFEARVGHADDILVIAAGLPDVRSPLVVGDAREGEPLTRGTIYIAPPDRP